MFGHGNLLIKVRPSATERFARGSAWGCVRGCATYFRWQKASQREVAEGEAVPKRRAALCGAQRGGATKCCAPSPRLRCRAIRFTNLPAIKTPTSIDSKVRTVYGSICRLSNRPRLGLLTSAQGDRPLYWVAQAKKGRSGRKDAHHGGADESELRRPGD